MRTRILATLILVSGFVLSFAGFISTLEVFEDGSFGLSGVKNIAAIGGTSNQPTPAIIAGLGVASNQINIVWSPSLGGAEAVRYNIYRDGAFVGSVPEIPQNTTWKNAGLYQDIGLSPNTSYTYVVTAVDSAGGESAPTKAFTARTLGADQSGVIPPARLVNWTPGVTVGVPGGIPTNRTNIIDVTKAPYNADSTGTNEVAEIINRAIVEAPQDAVVYLPAGRYKFGGWSGIYVARNNVTVRGAGMDKTIVECGSGGCFSIRGGGGDGFYRQPWIPIVSGASRGSTQITLSDASSASVGSLIKISADNNKDLPEMAVTGYPNIRSQIAIVTAKSGNTLTFTPPIMAHKLTNPVAAVSVGKSSWVGLEDMTLDGTLRKPQVGIGIGNVYASWVKNVKIKGSNNYTINMGDSLFSEIRHSYLDEQISGGTNHAGLLTGGITGVLFEDNIVLRSFPILEINFGSAGNVFAYNYLVGSMVDSNHGPHNSFNLYEGNVMDGIMSDGYFGGESELTLFRNWVTGKSFGAAFKRWSRNFSVVGNLMGSPGYPGIISLGTPNIGNGGSTGFAAPSAGIYWADWSPITGPGIKGTLTKRISDTRGEVTITEGAERLFNSCGGTCLSLGFDWGTGIAFSGEQGRSGNIITFEDAYVRERGYVLPPEGTAIGIWPRSEGFQEMDMDVTATTILKGNWYYGTPNNKIQNINESLSGATLPNSLYLPAKPAWFGDLAWPPFNPSAPVLKEDAIPAGYRYIHGVEAPGVSEPQPPQGSTHTITISKSGAGSGTVSGMIGQTAVISCGADCTESGLNSGTSIALTATPATGSTFAGWSGSGCSGTNPVCSIAISSNTVVTATFSTGPVTQDPNPNPGTYTLTVSKSGTGSGTVSSDQTSSGVRHINCGADCTESGLVSGATVNLIATPATGSTFAGWSGVECVGSASNITSPCALGIFGNTQAVAIFNTTGTNPPPVGPDTTPPSVSISSPRNDSVVSGSAVSLVASASDNVAVAGVQFKLNGQNLGPELTVPPYSGTWNTIGMANNEYTLSAEARDTAGNKKISSGVVVQISNTDTSSPSVPQNVRAASITQNSITLTWNPSTDNIGVTSYNVYRNGTLIASPLSNSYVVSGLSANTAYTFSVSATDFVGNTSAQSVPVSITTASNPVTTYTVTVAKSGSGRVSSAGISCGSQCTTTVAAGTRLTFTASPSNKNFLGWSGVCSGTDSVCSVVVNSNITVYARFSTGQTSTTGTASFTPTVTQHSNTSYTSGSGGITLSRDIGIGTSGSDVLELQKYLNSNGYVIASSGPGSPGNETLTYGSLTRQAVIRYQQANGISATGYVGPATRARITGQAVSNITGQSSGSGTSNTYVAPRTSPSSLYVKPASSFTTTLSLGSTGAEVALLQQVLGNIPGIYPERKITSRFDTATELAVGKFQEKYGISKPGDEGYGIVGPTTRAKLNEIWDR